MPLKVEGINGRPLEQLLSYSGKIYSKTLTMTNDLSARFETTPKKLNDVVIAVATQSMKLGSFDNEVYTVTAGSTVGFTKVEISTLFFKNATAGLNGAISILGVEE